MASFLHDSCIMIEIYMAGHWLIWSTGWNHCLQPKISKTQDRSWDHRGQKQIQTLTICFFPHSSTLRGSLKYMTHTQRDKRQRRPFPTHIQPVWQEQPSSMPCIKINVSLVCNFFNHDHPRLTSCRTLVEKSCNNL